MMQHLMTVNLNRNGMGVLVLEMGSFIYADNASFLFRSKWDVHLGWRFWCMLIDVRVGNITYTHALLISLSFVGLYQLCNKGRMITNKAVWNLII